MSKCYGWNVGSIGPIGFGCTMFPAGFPILKLLYFIWRCFALTSAF